MLTKWNMKKLIILSALLISLISFVYLSQALVEKSTAFPQVTITFVKNYSAEDPSYKVLVDADDLKINITDKMGKNYAFRFASLPASGIGDTFVLNVTEPMMNGNYTLAIYAIDIVGNEINTTQMLTIDVPYMDIKIINPPLSVSPKPVFDLTIETPEDSYGCKYDSLPTSYQDASFVFSPLNSRQHSKPNFNNASADTSFGLQDGKEKYVYAFCRDNATKRVNPKVIPISYDTSRPGLHLAESPIIITDTVDGRIIAPIKLTSDDRVVCRYDFYFNRTNSTSGIRYTSNLSNFSQMRGFFGTEADESNESKYSMNQSLNLDLTTWVEDTTKVNTFRINIACMNRATLSLTDYSSQRVSAISTQEVSVNLMRPILVRKISPADFTAESKIFVNITTNRLAKCTYNFNKTGPANLETTDEKGHTAEAGTYPEGLYELEIDCLGRAATAENKKFTIRIDKSPPTAPTISSPNATCDNSLSADLEAFDNESGIAGYNYSIVGPNLATNLTFSASGSVSEDGLNLSNQSQYYFTAIAINRAGIAGPSNQGNFITYDETGILCDKRAPSIFLKQNTTPTGVFVTFVCIDDYACNNDTFLYQLSPDSSCGGAFQPIYYDEEKQAFGVLVADNGYFCYEAEDFKGNKAKGYEQIKFQSSSNCYNTVEDGGETDVDCGGASTCPRCDLGKKCSDSTDCTSRYCSGGICQEPSCSDQVKNGYESDVDCGGFSCPKCEVDKSCAFNSDCVSNYCNLLICSVPSCTDQAQNGNESDVDCGGSCDKCDAGKSCISNSDCITDNCFGGRCIQQPVPSNETQPLPPVEGDVLFKILQIIFLMLGVIGVFGGSGYLYYKKSMPKKHPATILPAKPSAGGPEVKTAAKPKELSPAEKIRKLTVQEQMRREKEEQMEKRNKLFGVFGAPSAVQKAPEKPKPIITPSARRIIIPQMTKKPLPPQQQKKPEPKAEQKEGLFERLGMLQPKKEKSEDVFERLGKLKGDTEFEKLEKFGKGKKAEDIEKLKRKKK
jgi:hypothetical protein